MIKNFIVSTKFNYKSNQFIINSINQVQQFELVYLQLMKNKDATQTVQLSEAQKTTKKQNKMKQKMQEQATKSKFQEFLTPRSIIKNQNDLQRSKSQFLKKTIEQENSHIQSQYEHSEKLTPSKKLLTQPPKSQRQYSVKILGEQNNTKKSESQIQKKITGSEYQIQKSISQNRSFTNRQEEQQQMKQSELRQQDFSKEELESHINVIQKLWEFRYTRYLDNALKTKEWMKLFSFLGQFKQKCINIVKKIVNSGFQFYQPLEEIDYRYNLKNHGQINIYLVDGIIVRIANIKKAESSHFQFDQSAVKGLHQQFLAYNILNNMCISLTRQQFQRVRVPVTCLVKYLGYTALCQADTPCDGLQTLIHGPTATIYQYRQESMPILRALGEELNLKEFKVISRDKKILSIPFSLTLQLHRITKIMKNEKILTWINPQSVLFPQSKSIVLQKPEYYLLNIKKLWPLFIDNDIVKSVGYLRPQVVLSWKTKLSNTVFSTVSYKQDPNSQLQLADACKNLKQENIKVLAKMLDNTTIFIVDSQGIEEVMHEYGINMRFMGQLAKKVTLQFSKKVLQTQMIARVCKKYFFQTIHQSFGSKLKKDPTNTIKQHIVDFLNLLFINNQEGRNLYQNYIYKTIQKYYNYNIQTYPPNLQGGGLLHAITYHFGVKIKIIDYPFYQAGVDLIFNASHITDIIGYAKTFDMDTSQIKSLCQNFKKKRKKNMFNQCITELKILSSLNRNLNHQKTHNIGPYPQCYFYAELGELYFNKKDYESAKNYAQLALKGIPEKHADNIKPYGILIKYHSVKKQINRCIEYYEKSLSYLSYHLAADHPLTISVYNTLGYQFVSSMDPAKCQKIFMKSFQICQQSLGYMHRTSSEILLQLASLPLPPQRTITFLLQALTILQNLGEQNQLIKKVCMQISEQYYRLGSIQKMIMFAKKSNHWMMQIIGQDKLNHDRSVFELCNRPSSSQKQLQFLVFHSVKSFLKLLEENAARNNMKKLYVGVKDELLPKEEAINILFAKFNEDKTNIVNISEFVKQNFSNLIIEMASLIQNPNFYIDLPQRKDKRNKVAIDNFILIISSIQRKQDTQILFEATKKTY